MRNNHVLTSTPANAFELDLPRAQAACPRRPSPGNRQISGTPPPSDEVQRPWIRPAISAILDERRGDRFRSMDNRSRSEADLRTFFSAAADLVVVLHAAFVVIVVLGGLLVVRWPRVAWVHLPAAVWGVFIEFAGWICPLTPLENHLRQRGGSPAYQGEFIEHYILPLLYPAQLTRDTQIWLGGVAIAINALLYWQAIRRASHRKMTIE